MGQRVSLANSSANVVNVVASPLRISPCIMSADEVVVPWLVREHRAAITSAWAKVDWPAPQVERKQAIKTAPVERTSNPPAGVAATTLT
jgi:hypothetical protein